MVRSNHPTRRTSRCVAAGLKYFFGRLYYAILFASQDCGATVAASTASGKIGGFRTTPRDTITQYHTPATLATTESLRSTRRIRGRVKSVSAASAAECKAFLQRLNVCLLNG